LNTPNCNALLLSKKDAISETKSIVIFIDMK
jgi:hypothetical protein